MSAIEWFQVYQKSGRKLSYAGGHANKDRAIRDAERMKREIGGRFVVRLEVFPTLSATKPYRVVTVWDSK